MKEFKSAGQAQRFLSAAHDQINDLFHLRRDHATFRHRAAGTRTFRSERKSAAGSPLQYKPPTYLAYPLESG